MLRWCLWPPREDGLLNNESLQWVKWRLHLNTQRPVMEDIASVPLEKVKEHGDQESISRSKNTTEVCSVNPVPKLRKEVPGGVTCGERRAASLPSPEVPCAFPRPHLSSVPDVLWSCWQIAPCLNGCSPPFAQGFHSLALMSVFCNVIFLPFILKSPSPSPS